MVGLLKELGAEEGRDYQREHKVSPGIYADFASPNGRWRSRCTAGRTRRPSSSNGGCPNGRSGARRIYEREGWTVHVVTDRDLREGREETRARMRETLAGSTGSRR